MKKIYTLIGASALAIGLHAQASFSDDFESYNVGDYIGAVSPNWTTWDNITGGSEDTQVENAMNNTAGGSKSCHWVSTVSTGGPQDCVLPFGGAYSTGHFVYQMDMFVEANKGAYFNFQGTTTPGQLWALECNMPQTGNFTMSNNNGGLLTGTFPTAQWFTLKFDINLSTNDWTVYINGNPVGTFSNTVDQIAAIDIYAYNGTGNGQAGYYIDDVSYNYTAATPVTLDGAPTMISGLSGLATQTKNAVVTVRNLGTTAINSFDLTLNYNSNQFTQSFSSQNITSLNTATFTLTTPVTLAAGSMPLTVTISNVNGNASDGDPSNDTKTMTLNPVVPFPNHVVVGEEATGTWCPWCVRGTVFMDYMSNTYGNFFAPIAVHNADPMTVTPYDSAMGTHITGYPSELIDRSTAMDPSAMEAPFLQRVVLSTVADLSNGAQINGNTINVSVTYDFSQAATSAYKVACVLTEDSLHGTGSTWSQNNAYAGGANGPMGGFESLPNPVPYTMMHYDHVARAISPGWAGMTGFPATVNPGYIQSFDFTFTNPGTWITGKMHVIGMLIDPTGRINNASYCTLNQAVTNGYVNVTGVNNVASSATQMNLFPNPASDNTNITVNLATPQNVKMVIRDLSGKVVAQRDYGQLNGDYILPVNTQNFAKGMYIVELQTGNDVSTSKLIVQ